MAGVQAGRGMQFEIEVVAQIVQLQQDMDRVDKIMKRTGQSIDRTGRAANDNFASMGRSAGNATTGIDRLSSSAMRLAGSLAAVFSAGKIASDIVRVNTEFQSLSAMLKVATGSVDAASDAMARLKQFAVETPYGLQQSVEAFVRLKNLGLTPSIEAMRSYGNTAASMSKDLMQMVEAVADAATGEFERLKEFGIKASKEGEKVSFTFQGVTTTVANSAAEIEKYLQAIGDNQFAGAMDEQMQTLKGQFANLGDAIDELYVAIGNAGANTALASALTLMADAAEWLTENLDDVIDAITITAAAFVSYKAALLATTALQGVLSGSLVTMTATTAGAAAAVRGLTVAMLANPAVWLAGIITGVVVTLKSLSDANAAAEERLRANAKAAQKLGIQLSEASQMALKAADETRGVGGSAQESEPLIWSFQNRVDGLSESMWNLAKNARAARVEMLRNELKEAKQRESDAMGLTIGGARLKLDEAGAAFGQGDILRGVSSLLDAQVTRWQQVLSGGRVARDAMRDYVDAANSATAAQKHLNEALSSPIGLKDVPEKAGAAAAATDKASKAAKDTAKKAKELDDAIGKLVDGNLKNLSREMAKIFKDADAIGAGIFKASDDELEKILGAVNEEFDLAYEAANRFGEALEDLQHIAGQLDFGQIFGRGGRAVDEMRETVERLTAAQEAHGYALHAAGEDQAKVAQANRAYDEARLNGTVAMLGAAKNLFKEHSTGYKAMAAAEKAFAVVQMANTAINIAAGAAKMFATLGPFGFPAVAAMVAVMAGLGAAVSGGGSSYKPLSAKEMQDAQGTGSILGDAEAKSGSLANALDLMLKNTNKDLEYSNQMVRSLRAIESNIGALTGLLARQLNVPGGSFDQSGLGLGSKTSTGLMGFAALGAAGGLAGLVLKEIPIIGDILGGIVKALFGTTKKITLLDQGITFASQTVEDIINGGAIGQIYQDVQTQTKKKFFGVTTSNKTKVTTQYGDLDNDMERQVALIIGSLKSDILDAAGVLGIAGAEAALNAFTVNLGKISLKDLKGDEIRAALESVFSKLGDDMAAAVLPGLTAFQRVGEGVLETLARLARDYMTIDTALISIGMTFGAVGLASVEARESLIGLFGSLDEFSEQTNFFRENFLTEAEQMAPIVTAVTAEMARLGQATVTSKEQFKALVLGLDLSTASGAEMYASLMAVAPAFAKVDEYLASLNGTLTDAAEIAQQQRQLAIAIAELESPELARQMRLADERALVAEANLVLFDRLQALRLEAEAAAEAARIADERYSLESRLIPLLGDTAEATALMADQLGRERAAVHESNLALFDRVKALEAEAVAAAAAARAAEELAARNKAIADEMSGLDRQWLQVIGDVDTLRSLQLGDLLSDGAREKQQMIWAEQDRQAAEEAARRAAEEAARAAEQAAQAYGRAIEEHNKAIEDARNVLAQAYERESSALRQTIDTFRAFGKEIREFRQGLFAADNPALGYDQARTQFLSTSRMAGLGNEASLQRFTGDAQAFLDQARSRAGSMADYQRELALVAREALKAERGAGGIVTEAQRQIRLMDQQVKGILELNEKAITFGEALDAYTAIQARQMPVFVDTVSAGIESVAVQMEKQAQQQAKRDAEVAKREADAVRREETAIIALNRLERLFSRLETEDGLAVSFGGGSIPVTGSVDARITNPTGSPVPTKEVAA